MDNVMHTWKPYLIEGSDKLINITSSKYFLKISVVINEAKDSSFMWEKYAQVKLRVCAHFNLWRVHTIIYFPQISF